MIADCHKKSSGKTYPSVYGRMKWDEPAPTMTTQFYGFGNPEQNRALILREGAILQSFPKRYKFVAPGEVISRRTLGRLIGNAVPVRLGEVWRNKSSLTPNEFAAALRGAANTAEVMRNQQSIEMVWTGPHTGLVPSRRTEQVRLEVINAANKNLFVVSFVAYDIKNIVDCNESCS